jgi:DNA-binding PadR family transcriptional regulator
MASQQLTELEGAVLTEIEHRGNSTAFRVRRAFELSGSANWRGSAGAVYAAVRRLRDRRLIEAQAIGGKRGGDRLTLTNIGRKALAAWTLDFVRASDSGFDPFRLRAGLWLRLSPAAMDKQMSALRAAIEKEIVILRNYAAEQDEIEKIEVDLAIRLQEMRLAWIEQHAAPRR